MQKPSVLVTFDSMKNSNSGYYSFGKGLGNALLKQNNNRFNLTYYLFKITTYFNKRVNIMHLYRLHRLFFPHGREFDVVHFTDQNCRLRPYRVSAKKVMTVHDINNVHLAFKSRRNVDKRVNKLRKLISYCDRVVAISKFVADDVIRLIPEAAFKMSVIYNGADKLIVPEGHKPAQAPAEPFLFTIGLLSPQKGFHYLPALLEDNDLRLVIAGIETPHKANIIAAAEKFGCRDRVIITGPISDDDKAWYFKNCLAFVFPSIAEGFGLPVIEAMHFGKPVFLANATSLPDVGGNAAYYFNNFEADHMQHVFKTGLQDHIENNCAEAVMAHAAKFSWERAAEQYMAIYDELLNTQ